MWARRDGYCYLYFSSPHAFATLAHYLLNHVFYGIYWNYLNIFTRLTFLKKFKNTLLFPQLTEPNQKLFWFFFCTVLITYFFCSKWYCQESWSDIAQRYQNVSCRVRAGLRCTHRVNYHLVWPCSLSRVGNAQTGLVFDHIWSTKQQWP